MPRFIANLRLTRKLALTVAGSLLALRVRDAIGNVRAVDVELAGLAPSRALLEVVRLGNR